MRWARQLLVAAVAASVTACGLIGGQAGPTPCEERFSAARCSNMIDYAASKLRVPRREITAIAVLPPPTPRVRDGVVILDVRGGAAPVETLVTLSDGRAVRVSMDCVGLPPIQCQDEPQLQVASVTRGGYFDRPEGASPVPPRDRAAIAQAVELRVPRLDVPIERDGRQEVRVGEARLPNGILSEAEFRFVSPTWPADVTIAGGTVTLEIRSLDRPGVPFVNIYERGWVAGTERVEAVLVFDVVGHDPGAVLSLADLVVR